MFLHYMRIYSCCIEELHKCFEHCIRHVVHLNQLRRIFFWLFLDDWVTKDSFESRGFPSLPTKTLVMYQWTTVRTIMLMLLMPSKGIIFGDLVLVPNPCIGLSSSKCILSDVESRYTY